MTEPKQQSLIDQITYDEEIEALKEENRDLCSKLNEAHIELRRSRHLANTVANMKRVHACYRVDTCFRLEEQQLPMDFIKKELALKLANEILKHTPVQARQYRTYAITEYFITLDISPYALGDEHAGQGTETVRPVGPVS